MSALPPSTDFTGAAVTEGGFKTAITGLRDFLSGLFGTAGTQATALAALGALGAGTAAKTTTYTIVAGDRGKLLDCTSGTFTLNLDAAATLGDGFLVSIRNSGAGTITIDGNASELIDGSLTVALAPSESCFLECTGSAWKTLGRIVSMPAATASNDGYMTAAYATKLDAVPSAGAVSKDLGVLGVGIVCEMQNVSGGISASGATIYGYQLNTVSRDSNGLIVGGSSTTGIWRNVSNTGISNAAFGTFQKISA